MVSSDGSPSRPEVTAQIIAGFRSALRELRCVGSQRLLRQGVSMSHLHVMSMLDAHGPTSMSGLADVLGVSLSNATGLVDRMAERGLVERLRMPGDRRVIHVRITDHGRQTLGELEMLRQDLLSRILERLDDGALNRLSGSLADLERAVGEFVADDPTVAPHQHHHPGPDEGPEAAGHPVAVATATT